MALGLLDTARAAGLVLAPVVAQGVIRRRDRVVRLAERLQLDRRAARMLDGLRARHGDGPLRLGVPGRSVVLVLTDEGVRRVLAGTPEPFAAATREKVAALRHFQPHGVLVTRGERRAARRYFNERVLDPAHVAAAVPGIVREEVAALEPGPVLRYPVFAAMFERIVRRLVLGAAARDDTRVTAELNRLRNAANWAYLRPRQEHLRARFQRRIDAYVARAEPGSLAGAMAGTPAGGEVDPAGQVPHWLFAFDAAGITAFRTLALLGSDPDRQAAAALDEGPLYPFLRACVHDTVRVWPTTLVVLRESTEATEWPGGTLPAGTTFVLPSSYLHRAEGGTSIPFSAGPAACPGRDLVLFTTSTLIAALLRRFGPLRTSVPLREPLPATLDHSRLRLAVAERAARPEPASAPASRPAPGRPRRQGDRPAQTSGAGYRIGFPPVTGTTAPEM